MKLELHLYSVLLTGESNTNENIIQWQRLKYSEIPITLRLAVLSYRMLACFMMMDAYFFSSYTSSPGISLFISYYSNFEMGK